MSESLDQDAFVLWDDTQHIISRQMNSERRVAMLGACTPVALEGDVLTVTTDSAFAKRTLEAEIGLVEQALSEAAFAPMHLRIEVERDERAPFAPPIARGSEDPLPGAAPTTPSRPSDFPASRNLTSTTLSEEEFMAQIGAKPQVPSEPAPAEPSRRNHLTTFTSDLDSKLTFENFVVGVENEMALAAAKQAANGNVTQYNPLFIYGNSGLGKTHLLMSIKNYITANDPSRVCVYLTAEQFVDDFVKAMDGRNRTVIEEFTNDYHNVDVLILDDIQGMKNAAGTVQFFFETFNYLISNGKQIVMAADEPPSLLGMNERITSRMGSGFEISIQMPALELKRNLVRTFYQRYKDEGLPGYEGSIAENVLAAMADAAGSNIRTIKAYVQQCLFLASELEKHGAALTTDDVRVAAKEKWPHGQRQVSVDEIQHAVEQAMDVSHADLVGTKRNREIAQARHVAIWLCHQLTDLTYAEIGSRFGGRSHTTVMHSFRYVDDLLKHRTDRPLIEEINGLKRRLES